MIPRIDSFRCDGCGVCVKRCPPQVMGLIGNRAAILIDLCEECGICAEVCSVGAIHFRLPNMGVQAVHECYVVPRADLPNRGNWVVGVPRGYDGEGHAGPSSS